MQIPHPKTDIYLNILSFVGKKVQNYILFTMDYGSNFMFEQNIIRCEHVFWDTCHCQLMSDRVEFHINNGQKNLQTVYVQLVQEMKVPTCSKIEIMDIYNSDQNGLEILGYFIV